MKNQIPQIDRARLTSEQQAQLETYQHNTTQLQILEDIAKMTHEVINVLDDKKGMDKVGVLLVDIRESLGALNAKEALETPDFAKPVVEAVSRLEKALSASIKAIDVKPNVTLDAPQVNVSPPSVDLKGVERAVAEIPKAFEQAIKLIPKTPEADFSPLLKVWEGISEQLVSIESATRLKPIPGTMKVTNPDGSKIVTSANTVVTTSVASSATNVDLLDPNLARKQATFYNDSTQILYLKLGAGASTSSYHIQMAAGSYYELATPCYTGLISGIWASANGNVRTGEWT